MLYTQSIVMKPITVVAPYSPGPPFKKVLLSLLKSPLVERVVVVGQEPVHFEMDRCCVLAGGVLSSQETLNLILDGIQTEYLLLLPEAQRVSIEPQALKEFLETTESAKAGLV